MAYDGTELLKVQIRAGEYDDMEILIMVNCDS